MHIHTYVYTYTYTYIHLYIYIYINVCNRGAARDAKGQVSAHDSAGGAVVVRVSK
jgi:uncharacterized membrane protein